ncbi:MAG: hypothetical protein AB8C84_09965 [Oligoflexales bacterium]
MKPHIFIFSTLFFCSCGTTQFQGNPEQQPKNQTAIRQGADATPEILPTSTPTPLPKPYIEEKTHSIEKTVIASQPEAEEEPEVIPKEESEAGEEIEPSEKIVVSKGKLSITFLDETAGFQNTLGYYEISKDGDILNPQIIWENASHSSDYRSASETTIKDGPLKVGDTFSLGEFEKETRISFFLVADGYRENNWQNPDAENYVDLENGRFEFRTDEDYTLGEPANITAKSPFLFYIPDNGVPFIIQTKTDIDDDIGINSIYHAAYDSDHSLNLNPDGFNHIQHKEIIPGRQWNIGVEDLLHSPERDGSTFDGDFLDLTFDISFDP